jgi:DNA-binding transcriptional MerR regulator
MTIAEAGAEYGLTTDTLRYYERIGLIPPVTRSRGGNRNYGESDCRWVSFIKRGTFAARLVLQVYAAGGNSCGSAD